MQAQSGSSYSVTIFAGQVGVQGSTDGTGTAARFNYPYQIAVDRAGNVFVADWGNDAIRKITPAGVVTRIPGNPVNGPKGVAVDIAGNVYASANGNSTIHKITASGVASTHAGRSVVPGTATGISDGTGTAASFGDPESMAVDEAGNLYVADDFTVRKVSPSGVVTTLAGAFRREVFADGAGAAAGLLPAGLAVDRNGTLFIADRFGAIRKITSAGVVTTLAGVGRTDDSTIANVDGTGSAARFNDPRGIAVDADGNLYVGGGQDDNVRKITPAGVVTTLVGLNARGQGVYDIAVGPDGTLYLCDGYGAILRASLVPTGTPAAGYAATTLAGKAGERGSANGSGTAARFNLPQALASDATGNLYVTDFDSIRKIAPNGDTTTFAGDPQLGGSTDATGTAARFNQPNGLAVDAAGNVYVADGNNFTLRKITPAGVVTTLAGRSGTSGTVDGTGANARFSGIGGGMAVDGAGTVYVADRGSIRKVTSTGVVTTLAGNGTFGYADGSGSAARFDSIGGIVLDPAGNLFVADSDALRKVTPTGVVSTFAGRGSTSITAGGVGNNSGNLDGVGSAARFNQLKGIARDMTGNLWVSDWGNDTIRMIASDGTVTTIAGRPGQTGYADGTESIARFNAPNGIAVNAVGAVFVADTRNYVIRKLSIPTATSGLARLINLSLLTSIATAGDSFTMGYVVGGAGTSGEKPLVIRAVGPSLAALGVAGTLEDPKVELFAGAIKTGENDNWGGVPALANAMAGVGAFAYAGPSSRDAAIALSVSTPDNSVKVSAAAAGIGAVIAEIYDATPTSAVTAATRRLINVSVLKYLGSGLTAGFVIGGSGAKTVLIRAVGPGLSVFGVGGAVDDPQLALFSGSNQIGANDNWGGTAALSGAFAAVGAFALNATSRDAALLATLQPGSYTVQVSGVAGTTGVALIEVYEAL